MVRLNQKERIYNFIEEYRKNEVSPSLSEIAVYLGLSAKSNIHKQVQKLVAEGKLLNIGGRYVPASLHQKGRSDVAMVPLLSTVAAGSPRKSGGLCRVSSSVRGWRRAFCAPNQRRKHD